MLRRSHTAFHPWLRSLNTSTSLGGVPLATPIGNSANPAATTRQDLETLAAHGAGWVTCRTCLVDGFEHDDAIHKWGFGPDDAPNNVNTTNCFGYSPHDDGYYLTALQALKATHPATPTSLSVVGTAEEVATMLKRACDGGDTFESIDCVEVNLSCPNIPGKPAISYDAALLRDYLGAMEDAVAGYAARPRVGVKVAPMLSDHSFANVADALNAHTDTVSFVVAVNTVGNGLMIDVDTETAVLPHPFGGLGGTAIHNLALGNVHKLRQLLDAKFSVVGVGGVTDGASVFRFLLAGADAVQTASNLLFEGPTSFGRLNKELEAIMEAKGYTTLEDFKGKLRY